MEGHIWVTELYNFFPHFIIDNFMKTFILYYETKQEVYVIRLLRKAPEI